MIALAFDWNDPVSEQTFQDVPSGSTFYSFIAQLYTRGIINGYQCGAPPAGHCLPPGNLPYFLPNNNVTRGQTAKIVQLARTQPASTPTPTATLPPISTTTITPSPTQTPTNPACQGIPPSPFMQISPGICEPAGTHFTFLGTGFQPGGSVRFWLTAPDGTVLGSPQPVPADNNGGIGPLPLTMDTSYPTGLWSLTFEGVTSQHQAIGYFVLLPPGYAPKQSP